MALCVQIAADNTVIADPGSALDACQFLLVGQTDLTTINGLSGLFAQYFGFDTQLFELLLGSFIVTFIFGFYISRIITVIRK